MGFSGRLLIFEMKLFTLLLCLLLSGCTAHSISTNVNVGICVKAL